MTVLPRAHCCGLQGGSVTQRRGLVCAYLGIGDCDGKQLQHQLNRYGFTTEDVQRALAWADSSGGTLPRA